MRNPPTHQIAVVLDKARFNNAKVQTSLYQPGQLLERITPVFLPPYAPDHNPVENVWNTAKNNIVNIQHETPDKTFGEFASYITGRAFNYDFEHLPKPKPETGLVS